ncbi:TPA: SDR family NAD(P)-dependent oxidoreductase [Legionella anisa]|uniref:SDR family NAD(P)-dependent oxidoreductase n=1 Tax=Legionella anisa TaxID=28082 RepID=UPI000348FB34|nr:SDR family NAD(P)-dependent oxidoreductase [Legionella anisa]AWN72508.1 KR domain-containing protein [Legionella anisa]MCW8423277.1 SDR family NAD(P)-dependent oxidoreductase [Legionella anisa]MCW8446796.1 SDR family NAD(P)-dependent oxidoreductase [Legionella anisa]
MQNIVHVVQNRAQKHPHQKAIFYLEDGEHKTAELTLAELDQQAKIISTHLQIHQITGNRVILLYPTGIEFITSLLGCWYAGVIAVPIPCPKMDEFTKHEAFLNAIAEDADIAAVLSLSPYHSSIESTLKRKVPILTTDVLKTQSTRAVQSISINDDTIAYLQYTSGSTSAPKAAIITHGNLQHSLQETIKVWHYTKKSVTLTWAPHTHVYGLVCGILVPLYHGTPAFIVPPSAFINRPITWLSAISTYRITHSGCPNFGYDICVRDIKEEELSRLNLKHWNVAINGGDIVQYQTLIDFFSKFHSCGFQLKQFCSAYGMSELSGAIAVTSFGCEPHSLSLQDDANPLQRRLVSSGKLLTGLQAIAVDPETKQPVAAGETGEIWLSGKSLALGYWRRPDETQTVFNATVPGSDLRYFKTGDLGFILDNEIYLTGRLKEVIVIYGKKYYPLDLEITVAHALSEFQIKLPQVAFSTTHGDKEKIIIVQELSEETPPSLWPEIKNVIRHAITKHHGVEVHAVVLSPKGAIPKTGSGKLQRKKAQSLFNEQNLAVLTQDLSEKRPGNQRANGDKENQFITLVADVLKINENEIDLDAPLSRYSFDSINIIQLTALLNETYQLALSPAALYEYSTLDEFYTDLLDKKTKESVSDEVKQFIKETNDIAIIGMSGVFPQAPDVDTFWDNLCQGKDCISEVPLSRWNWQNLTVRWGGFIDHVDQFDATFFNISPREAELIDPQQRLFLQTVWKTIEDAGYTSSTLAALKTGLFVGVFNHDYAELLQKNEVMDAYLTTGTMNSMIANRISYILNLRGPSETIDTACSSSLVAVHQAVHAILHDDCDLALAGGVNTLITPTSFIAANQAGMLSEDGRCKTFDKNANGYVRGEGAGAILLKKLTQALRDGDHIYGVIKGTAVNHGGHVNTLTAPNPNAQAEVIIAACQRAQVPIDSIQYIETHGTGTPLGDPIEINGLKKAFQHLAVEQHLETLPKQYCGLGSVKTNIGHLESAAGIAGVIKTLLAMRHEILPANLHFNELNPYIEIENSPFYLLDKTTKWPKAADTPRRAGVSSFGFGGANAHIILEESPERTHAPSPNHFSYLICLSAVTITALQQRIADLLNWLNQQQDLPSLASLSYTLNAGRHHFAKRFCVIVQSVAELKEQLNSILSSEDLEQHLLALGSSNTHHDSPADINQVRDHYLQGKSIDWSIIYGNYQEKISLPAYPFAKESHWVQINNKLLFKLDENISTFSASVFSKQFSGNEFYLCEHRVNDEPVLPGAVCLEMVRVAACLAANNQHVAALSHLTWKKPIKTSDWSNPLHVRLVPETDSVSFTITNKDATVCYVSGDIHYQDYSPDSHHSSLNIQELKSVLPHTQDPDAIYTYFKHAGISYGPNFRVIRSLHFNETHLLAELTLPSSFPVQNNEFIVHPCLFDGVLQTTQALLKNRDVLYLPFSISQVDIYKPLANTCYVYAQLISAVDNQHMPVFNIQVTDTEGTLLLVITGFTLGTVHELIQPEATVAYYSPVWVAQPVHSTTGKRPDSILILGSNDQLIQSIKELFADHTTTCQRIQNSHFAIDSLSDSIILALEEFDEPLFSLKEIQKNLDQTYYLVHTLVTQISQLKPKNPVQLICIGKGPSLFARALVGFAKSLHQEQSNISCRFIELHDLNLLARELTQNEIEVRYDQENHRFIRRYEPLPSISATPVLKKSGVYLITGGMGGLGYLFASYLAEQYQAKIVLTGRSPLSEHYQKQIAELEKHNASVVYIPADVSSYEEVQALIRSTKEHFGAINGIIHAAGLTQDGFIVNKTVSEIAKVLAPKIYGASNLHAATRSEALDFFILFSSVAAVFGNMGQSEYAYANCFLDEFADAREEQRALGQCFGHTLSINWPLWEEGGLQIAPEYQHVLEQTLGIVSLSTQQGFNAFLQVLQNNLANCVVLPGYQQKLLRALQNNSVLKYSMTSQLPVINSNLRTHEDSSTVSTKQFASAVEFQKKSIEDFLKKILAETLKCSPEHIDRNLPFEHYGIDSLMIIQLNQRLANEFRELPKTLFFEYQNLADLAEYFMDHYAHEIIQRIPDVAVMKRNSSVQPSVITPKRLSVTQNPSKSQDIAIIGMSGRYPEAQDLAEFWHNLYVGKDCIREIPKERWALEDYFDVDQENPGKTYSKWGGFLTDVDQFDPLFFNISPREAALMDPQERLFLETAWKTVEDAGYARDALAGRKVGVYVGVMYGQYQLFDREPSDSSQFIPTNSVFASIANRVSYFFDFHGPSIALDTMCSSSLTAIHLACQSIREGECEMALAGGVNLSLHPNKYLLLSHGKFLARDGHCRSFGEGGDGYVPGEAVGAILLKPLDKALADGDLIYAVIKGSHLNHGGKTNGYTVPNPNAQADLLAETYQKANIDPAQVSYIEAHGTGTSLGDPIEIAGLNKVFGQREMQQYCAIGSVKSNIGHCESAAGIAAVSKVVLQLQHHTLVPSLFSEPLNSNINWSTTPFRVQHTVSEWQQPLPNAPRIAGISSFGAGGANAHLILSEAPETLSALTGNKSHYLLTVSAKTELALNQRLDDLVIWLKNNPSAELEHLSYTLNTGRTHFECRCAMVVSSLEEAIRCVQQFKAQQQPPQLVLQTNGANTSETSLFILMHQLAQPSQYKETLLALAKLYVEGQNLDWQKIHAGESKKKISLPTYPFAKERYWYSDVDQCNTTQERQTHVTEMQNALIDKLNSFLNRQVVQILKMTQHRIALEKNLGEYGMDSVHFIELAKKIAEHYQIEFTPAIFFTHSSVCSISQYLMNQFPEAVAKAHHEAAQLPIHVPTLKPRRIVTDGAESIAIIGMQGLFPQSDDLAAFWQHLLQGHDLVTEIPIERWDWRDYYGNQTHQSHSKWGAFINNVDQFDAGFFNISAREAHLMDPQQRLFLEIVWKTIEDAGYDPFALSSQNIGVFAGVEFSEYQTLIAKQQKEHHGFIATGNSHSMIANRVSYFFNFQGPSEAIDTACSSSLVAIHRAVQAIRHGECDLAVAGGVSLILSPDTLVVTSQLGALSAEGRCKTFAKTADGYVKGEGVASILLKPLRQAQEDGDHIYGVIRASAVNHGGKAQSLTAPNAAAQSELLIRAYTQAQFAADTVTYIETHGTGTSLGDPVEIEGLKCAFATLLSSEAKQNSIALGSVKTNIGHLEPASGIAGMIKLILAMTHETLPGILHLHELNPYINLTDTPFYIAKETQTWQRIQNEAGEDIPLRAGVSSFGFGGTNAHIILEEGRPHQRMAENRHAKPFYLITLSAKRQESMQQKIVDLHQWLKQNKETVSLPSLSFTLNVGRAHFIYRCALVVDSLDTLSNALTSLINHEIPEYCMINEGQTWTIQGPAFDEVYQAAIKALVQPENSDQYRHKLFILADLYTKHYVIDWHHVYHGEKINRLGSLPAYPFIKQRYWYDLESDFMPMPQTSMSVTCRGLSTASMDPAYKTRGVGSTINHQQTLMYLQQIFAKQLGTSPELMYADETYEVFGVDSLIGLEITNRLEKEFGSLPKTLLYERNRLNDLAHYLLKNYKEKLSTLVFEGKTLPLATTPLEVEPVKPLTSALKVSRSSRDIAIIGLSGTFPKANSMDEFWQNLSSGRDCISEVPADRWNYKEYPVVIGGEEHYFPHGGFIPDIDKFDPLFFNISPRDAGLMDPQERLFMQSVWSTLEDAGYTRDKLKRKAQNSVGVFAGVTYNFYPLFIAEEWQKGNRVPLDIQSFSVANRISYFLDVNGPSFVVDTACSSSLAAIHLACESLLRGDCVMAIAGGVNLSLHPSKYHFLGSFNFMSEQGRCASFAEGGTGYVPAEGVGSVLLKPLADAIADNDRIYGVIKGSSMNHGGKTSGYTVPNPNAQAAVILQALKNADIDARTVSYIEAHGTGTALGDPIEIRGLQDAFEHYTEDKQFCAIGSVKSNIGHLESAAGISQLAKVLLQMRHQKLVPTLHSTQLNPFIDFQNSPFYVQQELSDWQPDNNSPRRAGVSSFGAGGANVHMIIEEYVPSIKPQSTLNSPYIFLLSALNEERLALQIQQMHRYVQQNSPTQNKEWLRDACFTLQTGREHMAARCAVIVTNTDELLAALANYPHNNGPNIWVNHASQSNHQAATHIEELISNQRYEELVQHWINGAKVDWERLYKHVPNLISLPTYPFTKRRCWIPTKEVETLPIAQPMLQPMIQPPVATTEQVDVQDWLYITQWEKNPQTAQPALIRPLSKGKWLIFCEPESVPALKQELGEHAGIYCFARNQFASIHDHEYTINAAQKTDYEQLFATIHAQHEDNLIGVIYLCSALAPNEEKNADPSLALLYLFQAMVQHSWSYQLTFCLVSQLAQQVNPVDTLNIWQHHLWSMTRIFAAEQAKYQALLLDLDANENREQNAKILIKELELFQTQQNHVAYRASERYTVRFLPHKLPQNQEVIPSWEAPAAALITGGLGALGYEVAEFIVSQGTRFVLLTGTTELSPHTPEKNTWLRQLEAKGAQVRYAAVDVADKEHMRQIIEETEKAWQQPIDGVFHLAGITTDNVTIENMNDTLWRDVLRVKIHGSLVLHELFLQTHVSSFVLFSSIAAVPHFGMAGLSAYAVANEFMSGLALYRRSVQLPASSINWVAWSEKGMSHRHNHDAFLDAVGMASLSIKEGIALFNTLLKLNPAEITVCNIQWKKFLHVNASAKQLDFFTHFVAEYASNTQTAFVSSLNQEEITALVLNCFASVLGLEVTEIDRETPFQQYGMDSITGIDYTEQLGKHFPDVVAPMDLYRYPTLSQLTDYITQRVQINCEPAPAPLFNAEGSIDLDQLNDAQLNELLELELKELELTYE